MNLKEKLAISKPKGYKQDKKNFSYRRKARVKENNFDLNLKTDFPESSVKKTKKQIIRLLQEEEQKLGFQNLFIYKPESNLEDSIVGPILKLNRKLVVFKINNPCSLISRKQTLEHCKILLGNFCAFKGKGKVQELIDADLFAICKIYLYGQWFVEDDFLASLNSKKKELIGDNFKQFEKRLESIEQVDEKFRLAVNRMCCFLHEFNNFILKLGIYYKSKQLEKDEDLEELYFYFDEKFSKLVFEFEHVAKNVPEELEPVYHSYIKNMAHDYFLCAPVLHRSYEKPLGYAGDFRMMELLRGKIFNGYNLYAKVLNAWLLRTPVACANRQRLGVLANIIERQSKIFHKNCRTRKKMKVLSIGCGEAREIRRFIRDDYFANEVDFYFIDFNENTIKHAREDIEKTRRMHRNFSHCTFSLLDIKKILRGKDFDYEIFQQKYDLIYCVGLFDYLRDAFCKKIIQRFFSLLEKKGSMFVGNVTNHNNTYYFMKYFVDWTLIQRSTEHMLQLIPDGFPEKNIQIMELENMVETYLLLKNS